MAEAHYCIVGAGAAGLGAGYQLKRDGVDSFTILEASSILGGRARKMDPLFADFNIDLGAEWISGDPEDILDAMTGVPGTFEQVNYVLDDNDPALIWTGEEQEPIQIPAWGSVWVNASWFDFLNDFIAPPILNNIVFDSPVTSIDYTDSAIVLVETKDETVYECDSVIVTASLQILQDGDITFIPELPKRMQSALEKPLMLNAIKVFLEFSKAFYPATLVFREYRDFKITWTQGSDHVYYDQAFGEETNRHVLSLFAYGEMADLYLAHEGFPDIVSFILNELDVVFDGKASATYLNSSYIQDWSQEPYVRGAYSFFGAGINFRSLTRTLRTPIEDRIYLAGEHVPANGDSWGYVHTAAFAGQDAATRAMKAVTGRRPLRSRIP